MCIQTRKYFALKKENDANGFKLIIICYIVLRVIRHNFRTGLATTKPQKSVYLEYLLAYVE